MLKLSLINRTKFLFTRKDEDEKGADSSDDADDVRHVGDKHGDEKGGGDPGHRQKHSAATLERPSDDSPAMSLNSQHQVQNDRSVTNTHTHTQFHRQGLTQKQRCSALMSSHLPRRRMMG